jgi:exopolysaccharide production protein ExoQ
MPALIATLLTAAGVLLLLAREARQAQARCAALWLPVLWLTITGSRFVSQWINLQGGPGDNFSEGSPIDAAYFGTLIALGMLALMRRQLDIGALVRANGWMFAFALYALLSVAWSDDPTVAGKRWIKTLGHPVMALIILTEPDPKAAFLSVIKRCAFVLLPVSVLFIKYLPEYGRGFDAWSGMPVNHGIGLTKNDLGYVCMVCGIVLSWSLLTLKRIGEPAPRRAEFIVSAALLAMAIWLLRLSDSMTSLATMLLGIAVMVLLGSGLVSRRHFGWLVFGTVGLLWVLNQVFGLYDAVLVLLDRDPSLTDRTHIWTEVLALQKQPLLGYGFESFWLGERLEGLWARWWWRPTQAHNGYIETYLSLGLIGVALLAGVLLSTFMRITRQLETDFDFARLRMALFFAIVLFNYTEAGFRGVGFVWTIFHIIALEAPPRREPQAVSRTESFA